jgi:GT2 family glycosyltransferase
LISIIICSRDAKVAEAISQNVAATIGTPYELVIIDNSQKHYGICAAYNLGAAKAQYDLLCFMHEDLYFQTPNWGDLVAAALADTTIGIVGIAGGTYQVCAPASWNSFGTEYIIMNVVQHTATGEQKLEQLLPNDDKLFEVAAVDGLWMCCRKQVWQEFKFDETAFPDFHFYDIDFCTRVFTRYKVVVISTILVEHFSQGSYNKSWYWNALKFYNMRKKYLPFGTVELTAVKERKIRLQALQAFIAGYIDYDISFWQFFILFIKCFAIEPLNKDSLWLAKKYVKVKMLSGEI